MIGFISRTISSASSCVIGLTPENKAHALL